MSLLGTERRVIKWVEKQHIRNYQNRIARKSLKEHDNPRLITKEEYSAIKAMWGDLGFKGNTDWHRLYKNVNSFDVRYVPTDLYGTEIIPRLNRTGMLAAWDEKSQYPRFFPEIKKPRMLGCRIDREYYDEKYSVISKAELADRIREEKRVIVKPSDGLEGRGVTLWDLTKIGGGGTETGVVF